MTIEQIVEKLIECPSYVKDGPKRMTEKLKISMEDAKEALKVYRSRNKKSGIVELENHLDSLGLQIEDVKQIKFWQNFSGEKRYSVDTKKEWYDKSTEDLVDLFKKELGTFYKDIEVKEFRKSFDDSSDACAVISLQDLHLDKINLISETGSYGDVDTNIKKALGGFRQMLKSAMSYNPAKVIFIVGSDAFNANDSRNTTVKGTPQDVHYGWHEQFIKIYNFYRHCVDLILTEGVSCHVVVVEGNHDADKCFYLGQLLQATFEEHFYFTIDCTRIPRKYFRWGSTLIGFAHGDKEKKYINSLAQTVFLENKNIMADINYVEVLLGDVHHQESFQTLRTKDFKGCTIRFLRAVSELGRWEFSEGYVGIPKSMDAFVYSKTEGLKANLQIHL